MATQDEVIRLIMQVTGDADVRALTANIEREKQAIVGLGQALKNQSIDQDEFNRQANVSAAKILEWKGQLEGTRNKLNELGEHVEKSKSKVAGLGQTFLQTGRFVQDFAQGGIGGVLNNIEGLVSALGMGPGLAGILTVVGVAAALAGPKIAQLIRDASGEKVIDLTANALTRLKDRIKELEEKKVKLSADVTELDQAEKRLKDIERRIEIANALANQRSPQEQAVHGAIMGAIAQAPGGAQGTTEALEKQMLDIAASKDADARDLRQKIIDLTTEQKRLTEGLKPGEMREDEKWLRDFHDNAAALKKARNDLKAKMGALMPMAKAEVGKLLEDVAREQETNVNGAMVAPKAEELERMLRGINPDLAARVGRDVANARAGIKPQEEIEAAGRATNADFVHKERARKAAAEAGLKDESLAQFHEIQAEQEDTFKANVQDFARKLLPKIADAMQRGIQGAALEDLVRREMKSAFPKLNFGKAWAPAIAKAAGLQIEEMINNEAAQSDVPRDQIRSQILGDQAGKINAVPNKLGEANRKNQEAVNAANEKQRAREAELLGTPELTAKVRDILIQAYQREAARSGGELTKAGRAAAEASAHDAVQRMVTRDLAARGVGFGEAEQVGGHALDFFLNLFGDQRAQLFGQVAAPDLPGGPLGGPVNARPRPRRRTGPTPDIKPGTMAGKGQETDAEKARREAAEGRIGDQQSKEKSEKIINQGAVIQAIEQQNQRDAQRRAAIQPTINLQRKTNQNMADMATAQGQQAQQIHQLAAEQDRIRQQIQQNRQSAQNRGRR